LVPLSYKNPKKIRNSSSPLSEACNSFYIIKNFLIKSVICKLYSFFNGTVISFPFSVNLYTVFFPSDSPLIRPFLSIEYNVA